MIFSKQIYKKGKPLYYKERVNLIYIRVRTGNSDEENEENEENEEKGEKTWTDCVH